jgi:hypothetical protein
MVKAALSFRVTSRLKKELPKTFSAVWRSAEQQTHNFAPPPHDRFTFSIFCRSVSTNKYPENGNVIGYRYLVWLKIIKS